MNYIFRILAGAVSIYTLLCIVRVILSWVPGALYSPFGRFIASVCDPFLNIFSGIKFLRFGALDLSPILAFAVLSMASYAFTLFSTGARLSFSGIIIILIQLAWSVVSALLMFLIIAVAVRLFVNLIGADKGSLFWDQFDTAISPFAYSISKLFTAGKPVSYRTSLVIALVLLVLMRFGGNYAVAGIINLCGYIPF